MRNFPEPQSLRAIEAGFDSHAARLYHLGACEVSRSTLSDANAKRCCAVFTGILAELMGRCRAFAGPQSSRSRASGRRHQLPAERAERRLGAFFHRRLRGQAARRLQSRQPSVRALPRSTPGNVNDITVAKAMPIKPGATYVFDLGYYDYGWWAALNDSRMPARDPVEGQHPACRRPREPPAEPARPSCPTASATCHSAWRVRRKNPFQDPVRELRVRSETGSILRIVTNDLDAPRRCDRRTLQAALACRAVLPLGQAFPQNPPLPRNLRERRADPDRCRPAHLPVVAHGPRSAEQRAKLAHLHPLDRG